MDDKNEKKLREINQSIKSPDLSQFFNLLKNFEMPGDFLSRKERMHESESEDPFKDWTE